MIKRVITRSTLDALVFLAVFDGRLLGWQNMRADLRCYVPPSYIVEGMDCPGPGNFRALPKVKLRSHTDAWGLPHIGDAMLEPVTAAAAAIYFADRTSDRVARARQRRRLMRLAAALRPGAEVGERYGRDAGWYVKSAPADGTEGGW